VYTGNELSMATLAKWQECTRAVAVGQALDCSVRLMIQEIRGNGTNGSFGYCDDSAVQCGAKILFFFFEEEIIYTSRRAHAFSCGVPLYVTSV
jgi:hypothetical protein